MSATSTISVVNYGVSNIGSMLNMLRKIGAPARAISTPEEVEVAEKLILPGVGAFDQGMKALQSLNLVEALKRRLSRDEIPFLGVCLGMQLLAKGSEEGSLSGLGVIDGSCRRLGAATGSVRIPHVGWSETTVKRPDALFHGLDQPRFYFVHSYHLACENPADEVATAFYGTSFTAAIHRANVWGVQFHPEKSHRFGMALLSNFRDL